MSSATSELSKVIIPSELDRFNGVTVDFTRFVLTDLHHLFTQSSLYPIFISDIWNKHYPQIISSINDKEIPFAQLLIFSLIAWKDLGYRGVWMKVPIESSNFITIAHKLGFKFHHARDDYSMIVLWLPEHNFPVFIYNPSDSLNQNINPQRCAYSKSLLPDYGSCSLGMGGIVIRENGEFIAVQEKYMPSAFKDFWKFPGGAVDRGEDLDIAVQREVKEETGISAQFIEIIAFRHATQFSFYNHDIYFVALLKTVNNDYTLTPQAEEITACKWMNVDEFLSNCKIEWLYDLMNNLVRDKIKLITSNFHNPPSTNNNSNSSTITGNYQMKSRIKPTPLGLSQVKVTNLFNSTLNSIYTFVDKSNTDSNSSLSQPENRINSTTNPSANAMLIEESPSKL